MASGQGGKKPGKKRLVRVDLRRNRNQPPRDNSLTREYRAHRFENKDEGQIWQTSNPKGDLTRKRTVVDEIPQNLHEGTVLAMQGLFAEVDDGRQVWSCTTSRILRTRVIAERHPVAVGDRVLFELSAQTEGVQVSGVIQHVQPRRTQLIRRAGKRNHIIAANVERVLIVASIREPDLKAHLIDRYLVAAHAGGIEPIIVINKVDLDPHGPEPAVDLYRGIGYPVILTSTQTGQGLAELREMLAGRLSVVAGQSGVGKSSLLNALQPGLELATAAVSEANDKGRHTTTLARLLRLDTGGYVVDTPGVRSYELSEVARSELEMHFIEMAPLVAECKFGDCTHTHEDGCAIKAAVEAGSIAEARYGSYLHMLEEG